MDFAICEISGRQYLVKPGQVIEVDKLTASGKSLSVNKVLLLADKGEVKVGTPYLKETIELEVLETVKKPKIRVATYHAKANYRRVKGQRREVTRLKLAEAKPVKVEVQEKAVKATRKSVKNLDSPFHNV